MFPRGSSSGAAPEARPASPARSRFPASLLVALLVLAVSLPSGAIGQTESPSTAPAPATPTAPRAAPALGPGVFEGAPPVTAPPVMPPTPPPPTISSAPSPPFTLLENLQLPAGPLFELHPFATLAEEWTDNFDRTSRGRQENFRTTLAPGINLLVNGPRTRGLLGAVVSGSHDSSTDDTNVFYSFLGQASWLASPRLTLSASDTLTRSDEPSRADSLSLRRERRTFIGNTFGLESDWLIGTVATREFYHLSTFFDDGGADTISHNLGATATVTILQSNSASLGYDYLVSETSGGTDVTGHRVTASVARQLSTVASVGLTGSFARRDQSDQPAGAPGGYDLWSLSLFNVYTIPGRWSLSGSLGYSELDPDNRSGTGGFSTQSTFTYFFARATASLSVDQGFSETFTGGQDFGVVQTRGVTGTLTYPFTPAISGGTTAFWRENTFEGTSDLPRNRTEDTWGGSASLSVRLLRWLTLGLDYRYTETTSSLRGDFSENRARASLTAAF